MTISVARAPSFSSPDKVPGEAGARATEGLRDLTIRLPAAAGEKGDWGGRKEEDLEQKGKVAPARSRYCPPGR